jgi:hypothetical protein
VRAAVEVVDAERVRYLANLLIETGLDPAVAAGRARILNWAYLGRSLSPGSTGDVETMVEDLSQLMRTRSRKKSSSPR